MKKTFLFLKHETRLWGAILALGTLLTSLSYGSYAWWKYHNNLGDQLFQHACAIENTLSHFFGESQRKLSLLGKKMSESIIKDVSHFHGILEGNLKDSLFYAQPNTGTHISWVTANHTYTWSSGYARNEVSLKPSLMDSPLCLASRQNPWHLCVLSPAINIFTGLWEIPASIGITRDNKTFLGTLIIGFNIATLNALIQKNISDSPISFVVLDDNFEVVLQSPDNAMEFHSPYYKKNILKDLSAFYGDGGKLIEPIGYKNINYTTYKRMPGYPYLILTGLNSTGLYQEFWFFLLPKICVLFLVTIMLFLLIYIAFLRSTRYFLKIEHCRKKYLTEIKVNHQEIIDYIEIHSTLIHKYLTGEAKGEINQQSCMNLIQNIMEASRLLKEGLPRSYQFSQVPINNVLQECLQLFSTIALERKLNISANLLPTSQLPPLYCDPFSFKQIIISLLGLSMHCTPSGGRIKILTEISKYTDLSIPLNQISNDEYFCFQIEDTGIPLSKPEIKRLMEKFYTSNQAWPFECIGSLSLESVETLINLHEGSLHIETKGTLGKKIRLLLPYRNVPEQANTSDIPEAENVINFPVMDRS